MVAGRGASRQRHRFWTPGETTGYARVLCARAQLELELGVGKNAPVVEAMLLDALGQGTRGERLLEELVTSTQLAQVTHWTSHVPEGQQRLTQVYTRLTQGFNQKSVVAAMAAMDGSERCPPTSNPSPAGDA